MSATQPMPLLAPHIHDEHCSHGHGGSLVALGSEGMDDELDTYSNRVVDLIHAGKLDEAEVACRDLEDRYPGLIDVPMRYGRLYEALGDHATAARYYRQAAEHARTHTGFEQETVRGFIADAERLESAARWGADGD